jgi:hypothetical protein
MKEENENTNQEIKHPEQIRKCFLLNFYSGTQKVILGTGPDNTFQKADYEKVIYLMSVYIEDLESATFVEEEK